jgi:glucose/arabinose dehydrogenase
VDEEWKFGGRPEQIYKSIAEGQSALGMPAFGGALSEQQVHDLVAYIGEVAQGSPAVRETPAPVTRQQLETLDYFVQVEAWVEGLSTPWALAFLDARRALITEKRGTLRLVLDGKLVPEAITGVPDVLDEGQGGLLDVSVDPNYDSTGWIYLSYSHQRDGGNSMTRLVRGRLDGLRWIDQQIVYEADARHYTGARHHYGSRTVFDRDGLLYFSVGDRGAQNVAQDLSRPNGKIFRLHPDGKVPDGNPFAGRPDALPGIWSWGHRNPQGMAFHPVTGELWSAEHGPRGGDELNLVQRSLNYGWPVISYGINYNGSIITRERTAPEMEQPVWYWRPSTGVCAIDFVRGDEFPYWKNHLLVGALAFRDLRLMKIENNRVIHEEVLFKGLGRVRDVVSGPDGAIYVVLNDPHEVLRLTNGGERKY